MAVKFFIPLNADHFKRYSLPWQSQKSEWGSLQNVAAQFCRHRAWATSTSNHRQQRDIDPPLRWLLHRFRPEQLKTCRKSWVSQSSFAVTFSRNEKPSFKIVCKPSIQNFDDELWPNCQMLGGKSSERSWWNCRALSQPWVIDDFGPGAWDTVGSKKLWPSSCFQLWRLFILSPVWLRLSGKNYWLLWGNIVEAKHFRVQGRIPPVCATQPSNLIVRS